MNLKSPERTQQLLAAAASCFARRGFARTTMDEIAREAGVSAGLIYRHFAGKDDLIVAMIDLHRQTEIAQIVAASRQPSLADAIAALAAADAAEADPRSDGLVAAEIIAEALRNPRIEAVVRAGDDAVREVLAALIAAAQSRGEIATTLEPGLAAELFMALREGVRLRHAFASPEERAQLLADPEPVHQAYRRLLESR